MVSMFGKMLQFIMSTASVLLEELKKNTMMMVEQSKVLNTPGAEKQNKKELFGALRHELEDLVLQKASKSVWELILENDGLRNEISKTGAKEIWPSTSFISPSKQRNTNKKEKENGNSNSSLKKRSFNEMKMSGEDDVVDASENPPAMPEDNNLISAIFRCENMQT